jgi:hypothetical protein
MKLTLKIILSLFILSSCKNTTENDNNNTENKIITDSFIQTSCPFLTTDNQGNIVLSYVKEINYSSAIMCYAISKDKGKTFEREIEIFASGNVHPHGENMPKIIFKSNGDAIAMWGVENSNPKSKYSGLVNYSQSFDHGKTWSDAIPLVNDTSAYDQRYFDLEQLPNGEIMAIWLDNRGNKKTEGSTLFCAETKGKGGFTMEKPIGETCCQCCRTDLFIDDSGNIHVAYRDIINDSIRDMVHLISGDGGKTFSKPVRISADNWVINGCPHTGPSVAQNRNGLHFAWYTMGGGEGVFYSKSDINGKTFSERESVSTDPSAKHPQIISLRNGNIVITWDQIIKRGNDIFAQIGLQERDPEGKIINTHFISSEDSMSEFPVLQSLDDKRVMVVYKEKKNKRHKVNYKIIEI